MPRVEGPGEGMRRGISCAVDDDFEARRVGNDSYGGWRKSVEPLDGVDISRRIAYGVAQRNARWNGFEPRQVIVGERKRRVVRRGSVRVRPDRLVGVGEEVEVAQQVGFVGLRRSERH